MKENKLFYPLLTLCNICFIAYYLILGYYNQPATDDYCLMAAKKDYGFNSPITYWYIFWNGRIFPLYLSNIFLSIFQKTGSIIWFTIFQIIGFTFAIFRILSIQVKKQRLNQALNTNKIFVISVFIFNILVFNNFKFNTFYWLNAATMYYGGILFYLIGIGEVLNYKTNWYSYPIIVFSFLYAGTSTENHALVMVIIMYSLILLKIIFGKRIDLILTKKYYWASAILLASFIILLLAPGSQVRLEHGYTEISNINFSEKIVVFIKNFSQKYLLFLGEILILYVPIILLIFPIFIKIIIDSNLTYKYKFWPFLICVLLLLGATIAPTIYVYGFIGAQRVLTIANAILLLLFLIYCLYFVSKNKITFNLKTINILSSVSICCLIVLLAFKTINELPALIKYSNFEIEKRYKLEKAENNETEFNYKNPPEMNTPSVSEKIIGNFLKKISPSKYNAWAETLKFEPILPNIAYPTETKVYETCIGNAYNKSIKFVK
jgi:hypothetical protein